MRPFLFFGLAITTLISTWFLIQDLSSGAIALRYLGETPTTISGDKIRSLNTITTGRYAVFLADLNHGMKILFLVLQTSLTLRGNGLDSIAAHTELSQHSRTRYFRISNYCIDVLFIFKNIYH